MTRADDEEDGAAEGCTWVRLDGKGVPGGRRRGEPPPTGARARRGGSAAGPDGNVRDDPRRQEDRRFLL